MSHDPEQTITWLHLSDLHACPPRSGWDARRITSTLCDDLVRLREEPCMTEVAGTVSPCRRPCRRGVGHLAPAPLLGVVGICMAAWEARRGVGHLAPAPLLGVVGICMAVWEA